MHSRVELDYKATWEEITIGLSILSKRPPHCESSKTIQI